MTNRPTAEERVRDLFEYPVGDLDDCDRAASAMLLCNMMCEHAAAEVKAALLERTAQLTAHRGCCGTEHDPANGKIHGYCVVCGVPWPCAFAGTPPAAVEAATAELRAERDFQKERAQVNVDLREKAERERDEARQRCREAAQILIAAIGASGPEDVTTTAQRAFERIEETEARVAELEAEVERLLRSRDEAYTERNALVAALSKVFPASLEQHDPADTSWDPEWLTIVAIELPTGQATWHIHDRERKMFAHLRPRAGYAWDGHTTAEKYARLAALAPAPQEGDPA